MGGIPGQALEVNPLREVTEAVQQDYWINRRGHRAGHGIMERSCKAELFQGRYSGYSESRGVSDSAD
eukprot:706925-Pyramimonas_sp.AAC.1